MRFPSPRDVERVQERIARGIPDPLRPHPTVDGVLTELPRIRTKLEELEEKRLVVGLLGGTGVGKSTLLNALAGATISQAGDRRPTTDRVVCYRHRENPVPEFLSAPDLAEPPPHDCAELRGVVLLDLPDVDSLRAAHRERVYRVLPHLDLLLVVTSVEKYGDRVLYDEIREFPHAPRNVAFILNAVDRVTPRQQADIENDYRRKLEHYSRLRAPNIMATSATEALEAPQEQPGFSALRGLLETLGGDRARRQVLCANLETRLGRLAEVWQAFLPHDDVERWFAELAGMSSFPAVTGPTEDALRAQLEAIVGPWLKDRVQRQSWFPIGVAHFIRRRIWGGKPIEDPFAAGADPLADFSETYLHRPLRLRVHQTRQILERFAERLTIALPDPRVAPSEDARSPLVVWTDRLRRRVGRLAWRLRQHVLPAGVLSFLLGRLLVTLPPHEGEGWLSALGDALWGALLALSPTTLGIALLVAITYYLAVFPYFLYRLDGRVRTESEHGARLYRDLWQRRFQETWCRPYEAHLEFARTWWRGVTEFFEKLK